MIRKAQEPDIPRIIQLLHQVNMVHYEKRPDLFRPHTTKYSETELLALLGDDNNPIFVFDDGLVQGYAFCQIKEANGDILLQDIKTLYIDDICVDEKARGQHIGKALFDFVREYAKSITPLRCVSTGAWACRCRRRQWKLLLINKYTL